MADLIEIVSAALARIGVKGGEHILIACSGGPDSVALLDALFRLAPKLSLKLSAASFNHGLRPEAGEEVALVRELAAERGLTFRTGTARPADYPKERPSQAGARSLRLAFLEETRRELGADLIALGHTADDQAETVLMRLIRGSGPTGLAGIPLCRGRFIRPMLAASRSAIMKYLEKHGLPFALDPSNANPKYLRSRVRHDLLPRLAGENPAVADALARMAEIVRDEEELLEGLARVELARISLPPEEVQGVEETGLALDSAALGEMDRALARRIVRAAVRVVKGDLKRLSAEHIEAVLMLAGKGGGPLNLPAGIQVLCRAGELRIISGGGRSTPTLEPVEMPGPSLYPLSTGDLLVIEAVSPPPPIDPDPNVALIDAAAVTWPLIARPALAGDRIRPLGMDGSKKLSDIFIDRKVPRAERPLIPVVVSGPDIIWVAGQVLSGTAAIQPQTSQALRIEYRAGKTCK